ncbi:hypothetical protein L0665_00005, partial [Methanogenium marinum]|nr:hypothetical protein [Methanogenium marinum]
RMKIAPESGSAKVLDLMGKPSPEIFEDFLKRARDIALKEGIPLKINPYIIAGHPGEEKPETEETIDFLIKNKLHGNQIQMFTPTPLTRSTAMYYLGYDPITEDITPAEHDVKRLEERKLQIVNRDISIKKLSAREQNAKMEIRSKYPNAVKSEKSMPSLMKKPSGNKTPARPKPARKPRR